MIETRHNFIKNAYEKYLNYSLVGMCHLYRNVKVFLYYCFSVLTIRYKNILITTQYPAIK